MPGSDQLMERIIRDFHRTLLRRTVTRTDGYRGAGRPAWNMELQAGHENYSNYTSVGRPRRDAARFPG